MENELEKLIVRLVGDPTLYIKALSQAAQETTKASGQIESSLRRIEQSMAQNMGRASQNVVNSLKQGTDSVQAFTGQVKAFGQALTGALAFAGIGNGLRAKRISNGSHTVATFVPKLPYLSCCIRKAC